MLENTLPQREEQSEKHRRALKQGVRGRLRDENPRSVQKERRPWELGSGV